MELLANTVRDGDQGSTGPGETHILSGPLSLLGMQVSLDLSKDVARWEIGPGEDGIWWTEEVAGSGGVAKVGGSGRVVVAKEHEKQGMIEEERRTEKEWPRAKERRCQFRRDVFWRPCRSK
jgi:hypothetical protein